MALFKNRESPSHCRVLGLDWVDERESEHGKSPQYWRGLAGAEGALSTPDSYRRAEKALSLGDISLHKFLHL